jgi:hypothetical protein
MDVKLLILVASFGALGFAEINNGNVNQFNGGYNGGYNGRWYPQPYWYYPQYLQYNSPYFYGGGHFGGIQGEGYYGGGRFHNGFIAARGGDRNISPNLDLASQHDLNPISGGANGPTSSYKNFNHGILGLDVSGLGIPLNVPVLSPEVSDINVLGGNGKSSTRGSQG